MEPIQIARKIRNYIYRVRRINYPLGYNINITIDWEAIHAFQYF
jgi:hypothetical protein